MGVGVAFLQQRLNYQREENRSSVQVYQFLKKRERKAVKVEALWVRKRLSPRPVPESGVGGQAGQLLAQTRPGHVTWRQAQVGDLSEGSLRVGAAAANRLSRSPPPLRVPGLHPST